MSNRQKLPKPKPHDGALVCDLEAPELVRELNRLRSMVTANPTLVPMLAPLWYDKILEAKRLPVPSVEWIEGHPTARWRLFPTKLAEVLAQH